MKRHPLNREDIDLAALKNELRTRLGRPVDLLTSEPDGDRPGELILETPDTGQHLDVDPAVVAAAIAANPGLPKSSEQQFLEEFDAARDINGKLLALRSYIARSVDAAEANRLAQERIREHMRLVYRGQAQQ